MGELEGLCVAGPVRFLRWTTGSSGFGRLDLTCISSPQWWQKGICD
jgi:hypothetical protein